MLHDVHAIVYGVGLLACLGAALFFAVLMGAKDPLNIGDDPPIVRVSSIHIMPVWDDAPIHVNAEYDAIINRQWDNERGILRHVLRGLPQN